MINSVVLKGTKRKRRCGIAFLSLLLTFSFCMGGCGQQPPEETGETGGIESSREIPGSTELPSIAGTEGQMELRGSHRLEELHCPDPDLCLQELQGQGLSLKKYPFQLTAEGIVYRELCVQDEETNVWQGTYVQKLDQPYESWTIEAVPFLYSDGEREFTILEHYYHQGVLAFCVLLDSTEDWTYYWASCDEAGNVVEVLGEIPESIDSGRYEYPFTVNQAGGIFACAEWDDREMLCLNQKMEIEKKITPPNSSWHMEGVVSDASGEKVCWYGYDSNKVGAYDLSGKSVFETEISVCGFSPQIDMSGEGEVYVASSQKLWQVYGKELQLLCDFYLCDYPWEKLYGMKTQEDGSILLFGELDDNYCMVRALERTEAEKAEKDEKEEIVIAFEYNHAAMQKSINRFNGQSDRYHITAILKEDDEDWMDYDRRIQLEISAGRGPDIVSGDLIVDMSGYLKNGYFANLEGVIEDESQYLAAAFEGGRTDGVLYGMPYDFYMQYAVYSEDFTEGRTSWTLPELMKAVEDSEAEILQYDFDGFDIVMWYGLYDNDNTAYIDWEKGESHLSEEPFLELLDFAGRYGDKNERNRWGGGEKEGLLLQSGRAVATAPYSFMYNFDELHSLDACFDGKPALLGYPRTEGNGIYAVSRYLYVSSTSDCQEGAKDFLRFLLSEEEQSKYMNFKEDASVYGYRPYFPVNLNSFRQLVDYRRDKDMSSTHTSFDSRGLGDYDLSGLTEKQLEEIDFLLENIRPSNWYAAQIRGIIWEELEPYFAGDKTAEQAAAILNNRVQLYLDERK